MSDDAMTCAEAEPLLPLVADGAVDPSSDPQLFAHLATCPRCQRAVAEHDLIGLAIAAGRPAPAPRRRSVLRWWPYPVAAAAGLAAAALVAEQTTPDVALPAAPIAVVAPEPAPKAPPVPDVIALPQADGGTLYLVRRGEGWAVVDPSALDQPDQAGPGGGSGLQVRY